MVSLNINSSRLLSVSKVASRFNLHPNTIRNWRNLGKLKDFRTIGNHSRFNPDEVAQLLGLVEEVKDTQKIILYARVSTNDQSKGISKGSEANSLARQIRELRTYARNELNCKDPIIFKDTGSGINFDRPFFKRLIQEILQGQHDDSILVVNYKDRLVRWGLSLVQMILDAHGVQLVFASDEPDKTGHQELTEDLLNITHIFSCKLYSRRANANKKANVPPEVMKEMFILYKQGFSYGDTARILAKRGVRFPNEAGDRQLKPTFMIVKNILKKNWGALSKLYKEIPNSSLQDFILKNVTRMGNPADIVSLKNFYGSYRRWCRKNKVQPLTKFKTIEYVNKNKWKRTGKSAISLVGLKVMGRPS